MKKLLRQPGIRLKDLQLKGLIRQDLTEEVINQIEIEVKYEGYLRRQDREVRQLKQLENRCIPQGFRYEGIRGLRKEAVEKLTRIQPVSIGQASRISGVSPADITMLLVYLEIGRKDKIPEKISGGAG